MPRILCVLGLFFANVAICFSQDKVLMFVSHEETYYSEYIVMREALTHAGFLVEVRSATNMDAGTYMIPANTTIDATANTLPGSNYSQFQSQYLSYFGSNWNPSLNATPAFIPVAGSILDITDMAMFRALVIVGGTGARAYNVDGQYAGQGTGQRQISAQTVQNVAEKLNNLAVEAIIAGKPVVGQCHGAGIPAHWRYPVPNNTPAEQLGTSILSGSIATGFPESETNTTLSGLGISYLPNSPVVIGSPHHSVPDNNAGNHKIITTRDWYPQTIAHAALSLINILRTFPTDLSGTVDVLIIHGGAVNPSNCHYTNRQNDIPCNYGTAPADLPADYTHLLTLLQSDSNQDNFSFQTSHVHITGGNLPFDSLNECSMISYFHQFDVIIFFKHWSTGVSPAMQNALVAYTDYGGGLISLHHGLYNDIDVPSGYNKNILINQLFNAESSQSNWSAQRTQYQLINTNYGHFISTNGLDYPNVVQAPGSWFNNILSSVNTGFSFYFGYNIFDEIYLNMEFVNNPVHGRSNNQITPLYGIGQLTNSRNFTSGFVKNVDLNHDNIVGKLVFIQPGETRTNYSVTHRYGQTIRNAVYWAGYNSLRSFPVSRWNVASGNWTVATNWSPVGIPRPCDHVVLPVQQNTYTVTVPGNNHIFIRSLTAGHNATLDIQSGSSLTTQH